MLICLNGIDDIKSWKMTQMKIEDDQNYKFLQDVFEHN